MNNVTYFYQPKENIRITLEFIYYFQINFLKCFFVKILEK
jgi:hypothetical protein